MTEIQFATPDGKEWWYSPGNGWSLVGPSSSEQQCTYPECLRGGAHLPKGNCEQCHAAPSEKNGEAPTPSRKGNLNLCKAHKQEWKQSEYAEHNCDYCRLERELALMRIAAEHLEREYVKAAKSAIPVIHLAEWDGWIRFDSDCIINGTPVKAGTSWGPFEKKPATSSVASSGSCRGRNRKP